MRANSHDRNVVSQVTSRHRKRDYLNRACGGAPEPPIISVDILEPGEPGNPIEDLRMPRLSINGHPQQVDVDPDTSLLWVLRDTLGLTGTRYGCGIAQCGACTVHIDGVGTRSCSVPDAVMAKWTVHGRCAGHREWLCSTDTLE